MNQYPFDLKLLIDLCRQTEIKKAGLFGSFARGEGGKESDIDLLVEFSKPISLLSLVALERKMSAALGRKVDLVTVAAISPYLREHILQEQRVIYEAG